MIAIIYRLYLKPEKEQTYQKLWRQVAEYFAQERGAIGSTLHKTTEGYWLIYSRWPDEKTRAASWPQEGEETSSELPRNIHLAIEAMKECKDPNKKLPEICMEIIDDLLISS